MLDEYKKLSKVIGKLGKGPLGKNNDMSALKRNPQQLMGQIGRVRFKILI